MSVHQVNIRLPQDLRDKVRCVAEQQQLSLNQFCVTAIARAVGESQARRFFVQRAGGLSAQKGRERLLSVLAKVPR